jgi:invasion protein IalB
MPSPQIRRLTIALAAVTLSSAVYAEPSKFGDWSLTTSGSGPSKSCYVASEVKDAAVGVSDRSMSVLYISAWPKDGIKSEVSIKLGFAAKADVGAKATVGKDSFALFISDEHAFVADPTVELKLVDAMKKGAKLVVEATANADGSVVKDSYSLSGLSGALAALTAACP